MASKPRPEIPQHVRDLQRAFTTWLREPCQRDLQESLASKLRTYEIRSLLDKTQPNPAGVTPGLK